MGSGKKWSTKVVATLGLRKTVLNVVLALASMLVRWWRIVRELQFRTFQVFCLAMGVGNSVAVVAHVKHSKGFKLVQISVKSAQRL